jgi:ATP-binding cassette subfamily B protein
MLLGAFAELLAIGAILPFLSLLTAPEKIERLGWLYKFAQAVGAITAADRVILVTVIFAVASVAAGMVRLLLAWATQAFAFGLGADFSIAVQRRLLYQPYLYHISTNSAELVAAQEKISSLIFTVILPLMQAAMAVIISIFIVGILFYIDFAAAFIAAVGFCAVYVGVSWATRKRLQHNGQVSNASYQARVQAVQESLAAIRDIIVDRSQPFYLMQFEGINRRFSRAQAATGFIAGAPRFVVEAAGMILIAVLALVLSQRSGGFAQSIPVLGALALSAQRLLPLIQQIYYGWAQVRGNWALVYDLTRLLRLKVPAELGQSAASEIPSFSEEVRLQSVSFVYPDRSEPALRNIDLTIRKGSSVALIGRTGSGKSTLVDLLMGLLDPSEGTISIDGRPLTPDAKTAWQSQIAHVPQAIFLADASIARNIALGVFDEEIDEERVRAAATEAQMHEFVSGLPNGYATRVGERGVSLSGGQRQRLGIARALYKKASVLILDEATSALDPDTEAAVMSALRSSSQPRTIVMIAHRLSTVAGCDIIVRLDAGKIVASGPYAEVVGL